MLIGVSGSLELKGRNRLVQIGTGTALGRGVQIWMRDYDLGYKCSVHITAALKKAIITYKQSLA